MHARCVVVVTTILFVACSDPAPGTSPAADAVVDSSAFADGAVLETSGTETKAADAGADAPADAATSADLDGAVGASDVPDAFADAGPDLDATAETAADAAPDLDTATDAGADAPIDTADDAVADGIADVGAEVAAEIVADAIPETVADVAAEVATDVPVDAAQDATAETAAADAAPEVIAEPPPGCADSTREGFLDKKKYPLVAACAGAWDIPGVHKGNPACGRKAGNTGANAPGKGCNVEDLCAEGWHVCYGAKDLKERNPEGCGGILDGGGMSPAFFLARTSSTGAFNCSQDSTKFGDPGTSNDLFGCGDLGCGIDFKTYPSCDPLNRASHDLCKGLRNDLGCGDWCSHLGKYPAQKNTWDCGKNAPTNEANLVVKGDPLVQGGVLCCVDFISKP